METYIHPLSDVQSVNIGEKTYIWQYTIVLKKARIGKNCNINCQCLIENDVWIGDNVTIKPGVQIWDGITIKNDVFIGPNVTFTNDLVPRSKSPNWRKVDTIVEEGASIGANSTIIAGIVIGCYSLIGAGSLVSKDIPPFTVWYGNPAKHRGYVTSNGELVDMDLRNKKTGKQYVYKNFELKENG